MTSFSDGSVAGEDALGTTQYYRWTSWKSPAGAGYPGVVTDDRREPATGGSRLDVLKALGDNTRYAIYLELVRAPAPLTTADIAETLGLHVNTVRPHLERMRDVGLLEVGTDPHGGVGRPQHCYQVAPDAPSLGLEPSPFPTLARLLLEVAGDAGIDGEDVADAGREQGRADARRIGEGMPCLDVVVRQLTEMGFDPALVEDDEAATVAFMHCPFSDLAEANPDLVCGLHRGMVEGVVEAFDGWSVEEFRTLVDRGDTCQVDVAVSR